MSASHLIAPDGAPIERSRWYAAPTGRRSPWLYRVALLAIVIIACARVAATYTVLSETYDESLHIAAGLQWLGGDKYTYEEKQPPLAQVAAAVGPFLDGQRSHPELGLAGDEHAIMYDGPGGLLRTLTVSRLGSLPFLVLGILIVAAWGRRVGGDSAGLIAALLFSTNPTVLGHAGLANTDVPHATTLAAAFFAGILWLERPSLRQSIWLGIAIAAAILCKLSALPFLGLAAAGIVVMRWLMHRRHGVPDSPFSRRAASMLLVAAGVAVFVVLAGYRFSVGSVALPRVGGHLTVLAPEFFDGLRDVYQHNHNGNQTFFLGEVGTRGWWYYFPVMLAVKTPIPFLILAVVGAVAAEISFRSRRALDPITAVICAGAVLLFSMTAHINLGVRHVLGAVPPLAVLAGFGAVELWRARGVVSQSVVRAVVALLILFQVGESVAVHPDYVPYFNALAGAHPEEISVGADLDWGQDLFRLRDELRRRKIDSLSIAYFGAADVSQYGIPNARPLRPGRPVSGWIALSEGRKLGGTFEWLSDRFTPVTRVGKSILLYYVPADSLKVARPSPAR